MRLKNQAGADHAMIRLLKKCKRQSKMLNKNIHIVRISTGINYQFPLPKNTYMYCKGKKEERKTYTEKDLSDILTKYNM